MKYISLSDAKDHFSEFVSRTANGERFMILHRKRPLAAIIGAGELARLECSVEIVHRLAQILGQSKKVLDGIEQGQMHPAMAAYSLWLEKTDLADLGKTITKNRRRASTGPEVDL